METIYLKLNKNNSYDNSRLNIDLVKRKDDAECEPIWGSDLCIRYYEINDKESFIQALNELNKAVRHKTIIKRLQEYIKTCDLDKYIENYFILWELRNDYTCFLYNDISSLFDTKKRVIHYDNDLQLLKNDICKRLVAWCNSNILKHKKEIEEIESYISYYQFIMKDGRKNLLEIKE